MATHSRTCYFCKTKFETTNKSASFCTEKCATDWIASCPKVPCKYCTAPFVQKSKKQMFCSKACANGFSVKEKMSNLVLLEKPCKQCGETFTTKFHRQEFCSPYCKQVANRAAAALHKLKPRNCEFCKKEFQPLNEKHRFDTNECQERARNTKTCKQCSKSYVSPLASSSFCSTYCSKTWADAENAKLIAAGKPIKQKVIDHKQVLKVLEGLLSAIDATGGLFVDQNGLFALVADEEAFGIADAYLKCCEAIGRPEKLEADPKHLADCRSCGVLTSGLCENACGCTSSYCLKCRSNAKSEMCLKHAKKVA